MAYCSASKRSGASKKRRYGPTSSGLRWANQTSTGFHSGPQSFRMMLQNMAIAPSPAWSVASTPG